MPPLSSPVLFSLALAFYSVQREALINQFAWQMPTKVRGLDGGEKVVGLVGPGDHDLVAAVFLEHSDRHAAVDQVGFEPKARMVKGYPLQVFAQDFQRCFSSGRITGNWRANPAWRISAARKRIGGIRQAGSGSEGVCSWDG